MEALPAKGDLNTNPKFVLWQSIATENFMRVIAFLNYDTYSLI